MNESIPDPEDLQPEDEDEGVTGAVTDPLADPPGSRGRKAKIPMKAPKPTTIRVHF